MKKSTLLCLPCFAFIALITISHIILLIAPYEMVTQLGSPVKVYDYSAPIYQVCLRLLPLGYIGAFISFLPIIVVELFNR